jgi:hypothetical protein
MDIEKRVSDLETFAKEQTRGKLLTTATLETLQQGLQEACAQLGVSEEQFSQRFQAAGQWHYQHLLEIASDAAPSHVSEIDTRAVDQIPTDERPPRIFPEETP